MNLTQFAEVARRHNARGKELKALQDLQDTDSAQLLAELDRRDRTMIEHDGVVVTKTSKRYGFLLPILKDRLRPSVLRRVTKVVADTELLRKELKAGTVTADDLEAAELRSKPWPVVTIPEQEAKAA